jgi:peptide/nickel transport system permease protein
MSGSTAKLKRACMIEVLHEDYIQTAWSKGLRAGTVYIKHAFRNASLPVLTNVGMRAGLLLGGTVLVETVFSIRGLGTLITMGIWNRDYPIVQSVVLLIAAVFCLLTLLVDILYAFINPKLRRD